MSADIPLISLDQFRTLTKNNEQTLYNLVKLTIESFHEYKIQFENLILLKDKKAVGELAHKIKLTLTLLEANCIKSAIASSREILNQENPDLGQIKDSIKNLRADFDKCIEALEQHQKKLN